MTVFMINIYIIIPDLDLLDLDPAIDIYIYAGYPGGARVYTYISVLTGIRMFEFACILGHGIGHQGKKQLDLVTK